jgi:hypothetical protein
MLSIDDIILCVILMLSIDDIILCVMLILSIDDTKRIDSKSAVLSREVKGDTTDVDITVDSAVTVDSGLDSRVTRLLMSEFDIKELRLDAIVGTGLMSMLVDNVDEGTTLPDSTIVVLTIDGDDICDVRSECVGSTLDKVSSNVVERISDMVLENGSML